MSKLWSKQAKGQKLCNYRHVAIDALNVMIFSVDILIEQAGPKRKKSLIESRAILSDAIRLIDKANNLI